MMRRILFLSIAVSWIFAGFAAVGIAQAAEKPQALKQPAASAAAEPKIVTLSPARKIVKPVLNVMQPSSPAGASPSAAKVDLRPDVVGSTKTDPPIQPPMGTYNPKQHQMKPFSYTAVVENAGATKANNVQVKVVFFWATGNPNPFAQKIWEHNYSTSLEGWETVSYPFNLYLQPGLWILTVDAQYPGDEKNKGNNKTVLNVQIQ